MTTANLPGDDYVRYECDRCDHRCVAFVRSLMYLPEEHPSSQCVCPDSAIKARFRSESVIKWERMKDEAKKVDEQKMGEAMKFAAEVDKLSEAK